MMKAATPFRAPILSPLANMYIARIGKNIAGYSFTVVANANTTKAHVYFLSIANISARNVRIMGIMSNLSVRNSNIRNIRTE